MGNQAAGGGSSASTRPAYQGWASGLLCLRARTARFAKELTESDQP
jgi:hypothetical protein